MGDVLTYSAIGILLLLFSNRLLKLSLSLFVSLSTLVVTLIGVSIATLILAIACLPMKFVACDFARNYKDGLYARDGFWHNLCTAEKTKPKITYQHSDKY